MQEKIISFKTAKLAKEKGFHIMPDMFFDDIDTLRSTNILKMPGCYPGSVSFVSIYQEVDVYYAPTQSELQKWLRVHNIDITVYPIEMKTETRSVFQEIKDKEYEYYISIGGIQQFDTVKVFTTYEDSLEAGLIEGLKLII